MRSPRPAPAWDDVHRLATAPGELVAVAVDVRAVSRCEIAAALAKGSASRS